MYLKAAIFPSLFLLTTGDLLSPDLDTYSPEYIDCPLCGFNSTDTPQTYGTFFMGEEVITCQQAYEKEIRLPSGNCTSWQNRGQQVCRCADSPPTTNECRLCQDGGPLPKGSLAGPGDVTCAQLQVDAKRDFADRCGVWQQTMGVYCGCNNTPAPSVCKICGEGYEMKDPLKTVDAGLGENTTISCGKVEFDANLGSEFLDCNGYQVLFEDKCCEKIPNELNDISGGERQSFLFWFFSAFVILAATENS